MKTTGKKKKIYEGIECDSDEEVYFLMWCFELKEAGYISQIERAPTYRLTDGWVNEYEEHLKTKTKIKQQTILQPSEYTPDILLTFPKFDERLVFKIPLGKKEKRTELFIESSQTKDLSLQVLVEVKPVFDQNNMTRIFNINQKQMWQRYGIYVNLVKIPDFFKHTFYPKAYLKTSTGKDRKVKSEVRTVEEYLKILEYEG